MTDQFPNCQSILQHCNAFRWLMYQLERLPLHEQHLYPCLLSIFHHAISYIMPRWGFTKLKQLLQIWLLVSRRLRWVIILLVSILEFLISVSEKKWTVHTHTTVQTFHEPRLGYEIPAAPSLLLGSSICVINSVVIHAQFVTSVTFVNIAWTSTWNAQLYMDLTAGTHFSGYLNNQSW